MPRHKKATCNKARFLFQMHYFMIMATPKADNEEMASSGGAYVNCWINFLPEDGAELLAHFYIEQAGWEPGEVQESGWVEQERYKDDPETMAYFLEAAQEGVSLAFYHWPVDAKDTDVKYDIADGSA